MKISSLIIIFCIIWSSLSSSSSNETVKYLDKLHYQQINQNTSVENRSDGISGPGSWKHTYTSHNHRTIRAVHGTVNIIGWGVLLPIRAIIARYFKKECSDWYSIHIVSQVSGFFLGTLGWGLGLSIKNEGREHSMSTHGIIGTMILAFATLQADEDHEWRKYWVIYHQVIGYALIVLIIVNIFEGIKNQNAAKRWEWSYGAILGVLGVSGLALELLRWRYAI